jgi:hypothetical protein
MPLQKTLEKSCIILVYNIGIPAYSKITAHKFVKVKFFNYTCDMSKWPSFVQQMPCYKWIQTSETWEVMGLFQLGWKHGCVEEHLHFQSGETYDAQTISLLIYTMGGLSWI